MKIHFLIIPLLLAFSTQTYSSDFNILKSSDAFLEKQISESMEVKSSFTVTPGFEDKYQVYRRFAEFMHLTEEEVAEAPDVYVNVRTFLQAPGMLSSNTFGGKVTVFDGRGNSMTIDKNGYYELNGGQKLKVHFRDLRGYVIANHLNDSLDQVVILEDYVEVLDLNIDEFFYWIMPSYTINSTSNYMMQGMVHKAIGQRFGRRYNINDVLSNHYDSIMSSVKPYFSFQITDILGDIDPMFLHHPKVGLDQSGADKMGGDFFNYAIFKIFGGDISNKEKFFLTPIELERYGMKSSRIFHVLSLDNGDGQHEYVAAFYADSKEAVNKNIFFRGSNDRNRDSTIYLTPYVAENIRSLLGIKAEISPVINGRTGKVEPQRGHLALPVSLLRHESLSITNHIYIYNVTGVRSSAMASAFGGNTASGYEFVFGRENGKYNIRGVTTEWEAW